MMPWAFLQASRRRALVALEGLALDPVQVDLDLVGQAAVVKGLDQ
jgi:hypothetical protein